MLNIRNIEPNEYKALYENMSRDFPRSELPPFFSVKGNLRKRVYNGIFLSDDGEDVGYSVITAPEGLSYALVNFLGVLPRHRSQGYGSRLLETISGRWRDRVIMLEVEAPLSAKDEVERRLRERRIAFYKKNGFRIVPTDTCRIFGVDMEIMANSEDPIGSVKEIMHSLYLPAFGSRPWLRFIYVKDTE